VRLEVGTRRYDPLRLVTVTMPGRSKAHRLAAGGRQTLCGIPLATAQRTLDADATCLWCRLILAERDRERLTR
jgi:hypothetical protein